MPTYRAPATPVYSRIYEKIIWDTLKSRRWASLDDLVDACKRCCAQLRVSYRDHELDEAFARMGDKVTRELAPEPKPVAPRTPEPPPLSRAEAAAALEQLRQRFGTVAPKAIPHARPLTVREDDRRRSARVLAEAILDQVARCEAAEQDGE